MPDVIFPPRGVIGPGKAGRRLETALISALVIAGLYTGRAVLIPIAVAIIISFALSPVVSFTERTGLKRLPAVGLSVLFAVALLVGIGTIIGGQITALAENIPSYETNITHKIRAARNSVGNLRLLNRASHAFRQISDEIAQPNPPASAAPATTPANRAATLQTTPSPVEIRQGPATPFEVLKETVEPLLQPLITAAVVIVFVVFFLVQREDMRGRFVRLLGTRDIPKTTIALNDAGRRLSRYLLTQVLVNAFFGAIVGIGLGVIGIPNPILWGMFAMVLRFVPYVGAAIAALAPAFVALGVDPGWSMFLWTLLLFLAVEPFIGYGVEPILYGHSTGLSPIAVLVAIVFWTWLWGPVGLLLSTPLTLCLVVIGRHVERFEFFDIILGDQPPLTPAQSFYHFTLAGNLPAVLAQLDGYRQRSALVEYCDDVAVGALCMAHTDILRGRIDQQGKEEIAEFLGDLLNEVDANAPERAATSQTGAVMCIGGRTPLDNAASGLFAHMLSERGIPTRVAHSRRLTAAAIDDLRLDGVTLVCISYMNGDGYHAARSLVKRIKARAPQVQTMLGLWGLDPATAVHSNVQAEMGADLVATTMKHAVETIEASNPQRADLVPGR